MLRLWKRNQNWKQFCGIKGKFAGVLPAYCENFRIFYAKTMKNFEIYTVIGKGKLARGSPVLNGNYKIFAKLDKS